MNAIWATALVYFISISNAYFAPATALAAVS